MKVINWILCALLLAGALMLAVTGFQYMSASGEDYEALIRELDGETDRLLAETDAMQADLASRGAQLSKDLAQVEADSAAAAERIAALKEEKERLSEELSELNRQTDFLNNIYENTMALREQYAAKIRQLEDMINAGESDVKICYWTFDDGPSYYTQQVLDFAVENGIYVTFFTSREANASAAGDDPAVERKLLRNMMAAGCSVANHTNSHQYSLIAGNLYTRGIDSFREQVRLQDEWIYECTGIKADIFRFPGGSAHAFRGLPKADLLKTLEELGYVWVDWSCDIYDNGHADPDVATEVATALYEIRTMKIAMILSHDWNVNTVWAFKRVVPVLQNEGYVFLPLFSRSWTIDNTTIKFS